MRDSVKSFLSLGALPSEAAAVEVIKRHQDALHVISSPVSLEEADALAEMFGPDDCFGLSWKLLHLIESAPDWSNQGRIPADDKPGLKRLRTRVEIMRRRPEKVRLICRGCNQWVEVGGDGPKYVFMHGLGPYTPDNIEAREAGKASAGFMYRHLSQCKRPVDAIYESDPRWATLDGANREHETDAA